MIRSTEELKKDKKEKDHALLNLCCVSRSSPFCVTIIDSSINRIARKPLEWVLFSFIWIEKELMDDFSTTKSETRQFRILALYFNHLQLKGEDLLGFSHLTKEDYEKLKSHPRHCIDMDCRFQKELEHYLNSPVTETSDEPFSGKITLSETFYSSSSTLSRFKS